MNRSMSWSFSLKAVLISVSLLFSAILSNISYAQGLNLNLYGAYVFDDKFDSYYSSNQYYEGKIKGGFQWGIGTEYLVRPEYGIEIFYLRQDTNAPTRYALTSNRTGDVNLDIGINYIMLAPTKHFLSSNEKLEGFASLMGGVVFAKASSADVDIADDSATKFAWGLRIGGVIWASEKVGVRLQAQLLSAVQSMGGGFYFGTGGAGAGVTSYSTIYQFGLGGGLVFKVR